MPHTEPGPVLSEGAVGDDRGRARQKTVKKRLGNWGVGVLAVAIVLVVGYVLVAPALDQADKQWVACEVYSAKPVVVGGKSVKHAVEIASSCGRVWFDQGVDAGNAARIAREFRPHSRYEFEFGWLSRVYINLHVSSPNAYAWRA